jgi:hypothetical protein
MATEQEFNQHLDRMPDGEFSRIVSSLGADMAAADRTKVKEHFRHEGKWERDKWCKLFGIFTETEKIAAATVQAAEAANISANAARVSAEAAKTMAQIAEESRLDAKKSARHAAIASIIAVLSFAVMLAQAVISLFSYTNPTQK